MERHGCGILRSERSAPTALRLEARKTVGRESPPALLTSWPTKECPPLGRALTDLSFEARLAYVFDYPAPEPDQANAATTNEASGSRPWYADPDGDWWTAARTSQITIA